MSHNTPTSDVSAGGAKRRFPLYLTLAGVFVTLFVIFGLVLIGFFHSGSKRIELLGADDLMDRIGRHMQTSIGELYLPVQGMVDIASKSAPLEGATLEERLATLGALTEALRLNPHMSSIFVGYEDGEFFLVRSVADRRVVATTLDAPPGTRFAVQSIERDRGEAVGTLLFYDHALGLLDSRPLETADFDPRGRDWYRLAADRSNQITTGFYIFFTTGEVGLTFARRLAGGGGVVGADLVCPKARRRRRRGGRRSHACRSVGGSCAAAGDGWHQDRDLRPINSDHRAVDPRDARSGAGAALRGDGNDAVFVRARRPGVPGACRAVGWRGPQWAIPARDG
jgi:hypothetical protein